MFAAAVFLAGLCLSRGYEYVTKHITVPVDHFSFTNNDSFQLRYLINDTFWKRDGGPIFFYTGNEGDIDMFAQNSGFVWEAAPDFRALIVFAEHRYYGESLPYGNKSFSEPKYLGYLTSQQAMADYVDLITFLKAGQSSVNLSPVIAFGGSYGGMLAAWIRMKYPAIIAGSIAASAPILQFQGLTPCGAFNRIVTADFKSVSGECAASIRRSWDLINKVTNNDTGKAWLSKTWKLCDVLKTKGDVEQLKSWLTDVYVNLAMLNYPYNTSFLTPLPANPVRAVCRQMPNSTLSEKVLLKSLFKGISIYFNFTSAAKCLNVKQDASPKLGELGWDFQACTEMVMPICSDGHNDMFEAQPWDLQKYSDSCFKKWKVRPQANLIEKIFGGKDLCTTSNIVFSNGLLDPWASGGVLRNMSATTKAIIIPEGAHHLDLRASNYADPISVQEARKFHRKSIRTWIQQHSQQMAALQLWQNQV